MKKITVIALIILIQTAFSQKKWTVLGYFDGDQYFGDCGVTDVMNYLSSLSTPANVDIAIQADRCESPYSYGTWKDTRRFKIEHMTYSDDDFNDVCVDSTLGELNMGSVETLKDFLIWGVSSYPSERYILILKNHGGGWKRGVCIDETDGGILSIKDIKTALDYLFDMTGEKIDILAFDACLMGMVETAYELKDNIGSSFVFSQDFGYTPQLFNTENIVAALDSVPYISSVGAAKLFVDNPAQAITISAVTVSGLSELTQSISDFVDSFIMTPDWNAVQTAFDNSSVFGYRDSFMDLKMFFNSLAGSGIENAGIVTSNIDAVIIENYFRYKEATGLNIFFNHFFDGDIIAYNDIYSAFAEESRWDQFLKQYSNAQAAFEQYLWDPLENLRGYWTVIDNNYDFSSWQYRDWEVYIDSREKSCDDYLVSPKINIGSKSIFKFKAKSLNGDKFAVKLSETGNEDANDFNVILLNVTYPVSDWTEYSVELNSFFDHDIYIAIQCASNSGTELVLKDFELTPTDNISDENIVSRNELLNNYPNPFNPFTTIKYSLNSEQQIRLTIFNISGEKISELVNGIQKAGYYSVSFDGTKLPSGEYFYKLESADDAVVKRMLLLK
jgi:hypothetical protein